MSFLISWHFIMLSLQIRAHMLFTISELLCYVFQVTSALLTSLITELQLGWEWHCWYSSSSWWWSTLLAARRGPMATSLCERCWTQYNDILLSQWGHDLSLELKRTSTEAFTAILFFLDVLVYLNYWYEQGFISRFLSMDAAVDTSLMFKVNNNLYFQTQQTAFLFFFLFHSIFISICFLL